MNTLRVILVTLLFAASAFSQTEFAEAPKPKIHRFMDWKNTSMLATLAMADAGDGYTTNYLQGQHYHEQNITARPFVKTTYGTAVYFAASYAFTVGQMAFYHHREQKSVNHKLLWHRLERYTPITSIALESVLTIRNAKYISNLPRTAKPVQCGSISNPCVVTAY